MTPRIVFLERDSVNAVFPRPAGEHEWVEYGATQQADMVARLAGARVAIINKLRIDSLTLAQLPELRLIALAATGADNVNLAACRRRGVAVCNVRGYANVSVPEHVMGLILALSRKIMAYDADVRAGLWSSSPHFCLLHHPIRDLAGATLGLVGQGQLGAGVARLAEAFGMQVMWAERPGATAVRPGRLPFAQVVRSADVLSLHCPLNAQTRGLIGPAVLAAMKPTALLINTARGALVDDVALADALRTGRIAGAGIDVLATEPPPADHPLLAPDIPNLILTPHVAWASGEAMAAMAAQVTQNIEAFLAGEPRQLLT